MSHEHRDESAYRHRMRVRIGVNGPKGRLYRCEKKDGSGTYWKVRLDTGEWCWPADLVIDGPGEIVSTCHACDLRFMGDKTDVLCPYCDTAAFGPVEHATAPHGNRPSTAARWQKYGHRG